MLHFAVSTACVAVASAVALPFAETALAIARIESLPSCEQAVYGTESKTCESTRETVIAWRYALANAQLQLATASNVSELVDLVTHLQRDVARFLRDEPKDKYFRLMRRCRAAFEGSLGHWLAAQEPVFVGQEHDLFRAGRAAREAFGPPPSLEGGMRATVELSKGVLMPLVGFGTWHLERHQCERAVTAALEAGYRHIDTAHSYGNERSIAKAIAASGIHRRELFLATKLSEENDYSQQKAFKRLKKQLSDLNTSYVDVFMLHTPSERGLKQTLDAWRGLELALALNLTRAIGVSNFDESDLKFLLKNAKTPPAYIQNKLSIYHHAGDDLSPNLPKVLYHSGIQLVGYSVINPWPGLLPQLQDPNVMSIAKRYEVTPAQLLHRWALQLGAGVIPKSWIKARIRENSELFHFSINDEDMNLLSGFAHLLHSELPKRQPAREEL